MCPGGFWLDRLSILASEWVFWREPGGLGLDLGRVGSGGEG